LARIFASPWIAARFPEAWCLTSLALVVLSGLITTISIAASPSDNYLAVALSDTPLNKIKPDRKRLVVELIRQNKAASDENSRIAKSMRPISPALYSGDSFASKAAMESTSSQLKQAYEIDQAYAAAKHQARQDFHDKMQRVDPDYLRGFESRMQEEDSLEASIEAEEAKWVASALSLYDYGSNSRQQYLSQQRRPSRHRERGTKAEPSATDRCEHGAGAGDDERQGESREKSTHSSGRDGVKHLD
jgi:hypothetical protein